MAGDATLLIPASEYEYHVMRAAQAAAAAIERECKTLGCKRNGTITLGVARDGRSVEFHYSRFIGELLFTPDESPTTK